MLLNLATLAAPPAAGSPLGRFADFVTAGASIAAIGAALIAHLALVFGVASTTDAFLDSLAVLAFGVLYGTSRGVSAGRDSAAAELAERANLNTKLALAAHERLDKTGAPPSSATALDASSITIGRPENGAGNGPTTGLGARE